jgi:NAD(P)-dependent dehydrogenase (short-subunit alcohol dehydrogenase family)
VDEGQRAMPEPPPNYPDLARKVAVVTDGSRGIGAATARALATNGVAVAVVGRDEEALELACAAGFPDCGRDRRCWRPPAQIPACASTHWAPPLGFGVEAHVGPGVQDAGLG